MNIGWNIPYSFGPDSFVELGFNMHIYSSHLLHGKISLRARGACFSRNHSVDAPVNVNGVFSGHYLIEDRMNLLLATFFAEAILPGPG